jgi:hypothetical protein
MAQGDRAGSAIPRGTLGRDLFAVNQYVRRRFDADPDLIAVDFDHSDNDIVTNDDFLAQLPAKNQHGHLPVDFEAWNSHSPFATKVCAHLHPASLVPFQIERIH